MTRTTNFKKIPYTYVLIDLQSNPLKCPQSIANDVEDIEYHQLHHVWILTSHDSSSQIYSAWGLTYNWVSIALCLVTVELTVLYYSVYVLQVPN